MIPFYDHFTTFCQELRGGIRGTSVCDLSALKNTNHHRLRDHYQLDEASRRPVRKAYMERLQQSCRLTHELLRPPQACFSDASGAPHQPDIAQLRMAESFHATALSWIQELEVLVIDLRQAGGLPLCEPQKTKGIYPSSGILIEELSPDTAAKAQERQLQEQLISNSCLVVALYAADSVLLTPWTTHQLGIASRDLLQALAPSGLLAVAENMLQGVAGQQQPTHEQFLVSALPHLLSHFKLCFNHDVYQYEKAQVPKESGWAQNHPSSDNSQSLGRGSCSVKFT